MEPVQEPEPLICVRATAGSAKASRASGRMQAWRIDGYPLAWSHCQRVQVKPACGTSPDLPSS